MKKSTVKGKSASTSNKKKPSPRKKSKGELKGLAEPEQNLFYYGPPPAIRALYNNRSGYDKDFHPADLLKHMQEGSSRSEICAAWGITYDTFNKWIDAHKDFADAYAVGKPAFDAYYKRALRHSAFGQMKSVREASLFFMLKNSAGYDEGGGSHEYGDAAGATVEFVDDEDQAS